MTNDTKWLIAIIVLMLLALIGVGTMLFNLPTPRGMIDENNARYPEHGVTEKGMRIWKHPDGAWYNMYGEKVIFKEDK